MEAWYAVHAKSHKEGYVKAYLESQGLESFYPYLQVTPINPRSSTVRSYFPGYLFVRADLETTGISSLRWIPGAVGLVEFGGVPAVVPDAVIQQLKIRLRDAQARPAGEQSRFKHGDSVRIVRGPFKGFEGIFDARLSGTQRVLLLLDMLGRLVRAEINADAIEGKPSR